MSESYIKNVIEAALLAAGRPLQVNELAELFDESNRPDSTTLRAALASLEADYDGRGIEVKETATGFRIQVRRDLANEISRLWPERPPRYSRALLETLALIAYRQPITRGEIEAVRGVAVNPNIIKTILERNWVRVVGTRDVPGRPELLGTTKEFLDYFGLRGLDDLPPLAELKAMGDINLQLDLAKEGGTSIGAGLAGSIGHESDEETEQANGVVHVEAVDAERDEGGDSDSDSDVEGAAQVAESDEPGPKVLTAQAELDVDDLDATSLDDDGGDDDDDDELSAADPDSSTELVAAPRDRDD